MQAMQLQLQICADWIVLCSQRTGGQNLGRGSIKIMILQLATSTTLEFFFVYQLCLSTATMKLSRSRYTNLEYCSVEVLSKHVWIASFFAAACFCSSRRFTIRYYVVDKSNPSKMFHSFSSYCTHEKSFFDDNVHDTTDLIICQQPQFFLCITDPLQLCERMTHRQRLGERRSACMMLERSLAVWIDVRTTLI